MTLFTLSLTAECYPSMTRLSLTLTFGQCEEKIAFFSPHWLTSFNTLLRTVPVSPMEVIYRFYKGHKMFLFRKVAAHVKIH